MAQALTRDEAIKHLQKYYAEEQVIVLSIWSAEDILDERDEDTQMDIWADVAESFATHAFDRPTELLYDSLSELTYRWREDNG